MKQIVFINHDNVGDSLLCYQIIDSLVYYIPSLEVYLYNKNIKQTEMFFKNHPNIKSIDVISTRVSSISFLKKVWKLYQDILKLLQKDDVYIMCLLGSTTISVTLQPLLFWNTFFGKNKIKILQLKPVFNLIKPNQHLIDFSFEIFSHVLGKKIIEHKTHPLLPISHQMGRDIKVISIVSGASGPWKMLPAEKFVDIISYFQKHGYQIKLLGSKSNFDMTQNQKIVGYLANNNNIQNLCGKTSIIGYIEELIKSDYIITNDSSAQHVANYFDIPCCVIWGRDKNNNVVHAYSWKKDNIINIFNEPYVKKFFGGFHAASGRKLSRERHNIALNFAAIPVEKIINGVEEHIKKLHDKP